MTEPRDSFLAVPYDAHGNALPPFSVRQQSTLSGAWGAARGALGRQACAFALYDHAGALVRIGVNCPEPTTDDPDASAMALDASGTRLVTGHTDGNLRLWDLASGDPIWTRAPADEPITGVAIVEKGPWVIAWSDDGPLLVFARDSGELVNRIEDPQIGAFTAVVARDGSQIAMTGAHVVRLALPGGELLATLDADRESSPAGDAGVQWVEFLPGATDLVGARAAAPTDDVVFWNGGNGGRTATISHLEGIAACDLSPDGSLAAIGVAGARASVTVIDTRLHTVSRTIDLPHEEIHDLRFARGTTLLVADVKHGVVRVDVATGEVSEPFRRDGCDVLRLRTTERDAASEPDTAPLMVTRDRDGRIELTRLAARGPFRPDGRSVSSDGRRYAMIDEPIGDECVTVFDVDRGTPIATLAGSHAVHEIWLSGDGSRVATRAGGHVTVWSVPLAPPGLE